MSRIRNLADFAKLNFDGEFGDLTDIDLNIRPEVLTIQVDSPGAGHSTPWLWTWASGQVSYTRLKITNLEQSSIPLYKAGTYIVNNFAGQELHGSMTQTHSIHLKWINGAGTQNNVSWAESVTVTGVLHESINNGQATTVQRLLINVPANITLPTLTPPTVTYNVSFTQAGSYTFMGTAMGQNPSLGPLYRGGTYTFNLDGSLSGAHPFYLTTDDGSSYSSGNYVGEYTSGVTGSRNDSGTLVFTVPLDAPDTLYYQCGNHSMMRGSIEIKDLAVETNNDGNYILYFQHSQEGMFTPVEIRPIPTFETTVDKVCMVFNTTTKKFEPQDLGQYLDNTTQFQTKITDLISTTTNDKVTASQVTFQIKDETVLAINMHQNGELAVTTGTKRWYAPYDLNIVDIRPKLGTAADNIVTADIKKNGSTIKTVSFTPNSTSTTVASPSFSMSEDDYLTVDVTTVGETIKGEDLYIQLKYKKA